MLKKYATYFAAHLVNSTTQLENITRIVLYGSVAKGTATKESDVDIFIEVKRKTQKFENEIKKIEENFYKSREAALFKTKEIDNKLSIKIGVLTEWKELYKSIASTGITLYGPYEAKELPSGVKHNVIAFWDSIGKNRGAFLNKIYGFKIKGKAYAGFLTKSEGKKLGKSCIMIPIQQKEDLFKLLQKYEVKARTIEVFA